MQIPGARLIPVADARSLIELLLARHLAGRDLEIALDDELMLIDDGGAAILALLDGTVIDGDLVLDWEQATHAGARYRGVLALGALTVTGDIVNDNWDGGPFLVGLGPLTARQVLKRGAPLVVGGRVTMAGTIYCEYNHGVFRALDGVTAQGLIIDGHDHQIDGTVDAVMVVLGMALPGQRDPREVLLPEFFYEEDEYGHVDPVDDLGEVLKARIKAGQPIFRTDAPRGR